MRSWRGTLSLLQYASVSFWPFNLSMHTFSGAALHLRCPLGDLIDMNNALMTRYIKSIAVRLRRSCPCGECWIRTLPVVRKRKLGENTVLMTWYIVFVAGRFLSAFAHLSFSMLWASVSSWPSKLFNALAAPRLLLIGFCQLLAIQRF